MEKAPRILPHNLEVEQSLLGSLFLSQDAQSECFAKMQPNDFYSTGHQKIFKAMYESYIGNKGVDYVTVAKNLDSKGELEDVGGIEYVADLTNAVPSASNFKNYMEIVQNDATMRRLIELCQDGINYCFANTNSKTALQHLEKQIFDLSKEKDISELVQINEGVNQVIDRMEKLSIDKNAFRGIKTGFPTLDNYTKGFHKGDLILLAARPGIGKTSLALNICSNAALYGGATVAIFSLEMPISQIAQRTMCSVGNITMDNATSGTTNSRVWETVMQTKEELSNAQLYVDDSSLTTPTQILSKCRRLKAEKGLDMVMIDYLQLMKSDTTKDSGNRQQEVADLTRSLKIAARELECPIIVLSQLSRDIEKRTDHKPQLSDLRESGAIEQDADIVMFIDRVNEANQDLDSEDVSAEPSADDGENCKLIIAKHRNGSLGSILLKWYGQYTRFEEPKANRLSEAPVHNVSNDTTELIPVANDDFDGSF
ncbi:MAG: replicative DNA helicase [Clostridia bacterium]